MPRLGLIIDLEKCYGCDACTAACRNEHLWPDDAPFTAVLKEADTTPDRLTLPVRCMLCDHPACARACEAGALVSDRDGVIVFKEGACTGCGACIDACPYRMIAATERSSDLSMRSMMTPVQRALSEMWERRRRDRLPSKCDLCAARRAEGRLPACVAICPTSVYSIGDLNDPDSDISKAVRSRAVEALPSETGASPRLYYRLPRGVTLARVVPLFEIWMRRNRES
jgi:Fe-S-cluster-containing dehydrogenase component